jgi:hypothetical protein
MQPYGVARAAVPLEGSTNEFVFSTTRSELRSVVDDHELDA